MKKKKKIEVRKIALISMLLLCFILGYVANVVCKNRNLTIFEQAIKDSVLTIQNIITYPIDFIIDRINISKEKNKMYNEYELLKQQLSDSEKYIIENQELKKQLEEIKNILNLNNIPSDYDTIHATVIGRDLTYWNNNITIDKGTNDGVTVGLPVVVADGLIGKIVKTTNFNSTIRLLTADDSSDKLSVKINSGEEYTYGILSKYDKDTNSYIIEGISENIEIKEDSLVTTTGMGDIFPAGILVGKVKGISTDNFDLSNVLQIESNVDFNDINYVVVLKRKDL